MKRQTLIVMMLMLTLFTTTACMQQEAIDSANETLAQENDQEEVDSVSEATESIDTTTTASVVPQNLRNTYIPKGFSDSDKKKALFVVGDPRKYSVNYDMTYTAMKYFEDNDIEVELRDLYDMNWNPVLTADEFYYQKDGVGEVPKDVEFEQNLVQNSDYIVFVYPNWHDTPNAMVKGYMERVFASQFAYTNVGPKGLLNGKGMYTISNCGFLGGGRGFIGDGVGINDQLWDEYMKAFKVLDDDTAGWWGMENKGRFMNDRTPSNSSEEYELEINKLRDALINHLNQTFFN